jgi:UDP-N-acetylmuramyl pentapeptide phosphotransferase/UDP-N-acetylglucosamine-1-phosphate transferase
MSIATGLIILGVGAVVAYATTRLFLPLLRAHVMDDPNERSSHTVPTPRGGGIGIVAGLTAGLLVAGLCGAPVPHWRILVGTVLVAVTGFIDDMWTLKALPRFTVMILAALLVTIPSGGFSVLPLPTPLDLSIPIWLGMALATLWIVGVVNIYNFLDGIDGYAGVQGIVAGIGIWVYDQNGPLGTAGAILAGACAGFLVLNWHPARIFMGDVGSTTLGYLFAALPFARSQGDRAESAFVVALMLWFFLADGVFAIIRRLLKGERVYEAHREHVYQRLVATGIPHDRVVMILMGAGALVAASAKIADSLDADLLRWVVFGSGIVLFVGFIWLTNWRERRQKTT